MSGSASSSLNNACLPFGGRTASCRDRPDRKVRAGDAGDANEEHSSSSCCALDPGIGFPGMASNQMALVVLQFHGCGTRWHGLTKQHILSCLVCGSHGTRKLGERTMEAIEQWMCGCMGRCSDCSERAPILCHCAHCAFCCARRRGLLLRGSPMRACAPMPKGAIGPHGPLQFAPATPRRCDCHKSRNLGEGARRRLWALISMTHNMLQCCWNLGRRGEV